MQRVLIPLGAVAVIAAAIYILTYEPPTGTVVPASAPPTEVAAAPPTEADPAPITRAPPTEAPASEAPPPVDAGPQPDAARPTGPVEINLGTHTVAMRDSKRRLKVEIVLTVDNATTQREVRAKRRKLVRMLYFLSAHRVEDGLLGAGGKTRFLADLRERFGNVIRTGDIRDLRFARFEAVEPVEPVEEPK